MRGDIQPQLQSAKVACLKKGQLAIVCSAGLAVILIRVGRHEEDCGVDVLILGCCDVVPRYV